MAQQREKDETLDLKVPSDPPLTCIITRPDPTRLDPLPTMPRLSDRADEVAAPSSPAPAALNHSRGSGGSDPTAVRRSVNRCCGCGKRVGLTGFRCRCGDLFCSEHRYSDRHDCSYDYKGAGREAIARENPVVRPAKILKV